MFYWKNIFIPFLYKHEVVSHTVILISGEIFFLHFHKWNILYVPNTIIKNLCTLSTEYGFENKRRLFTFTALTFKNLASYI